MKGGKWKELINRCHPQSSLDSLTVDESHLHSLRFRAIILGNC
jgi:hypothetical protein